MLIELEPEPIDIEVFDRTFDELEYDIQLAEEDAPIAYEDIMLEEDKVALDMLDQSLFRGN